MNSEVHKTGRSSCRPFGLEFFLSWLPRLHGAGLLHLGLMSLFGLAGERHALPVFVVSNFTGKTVSGSHVADYRFVKTAKSD
jgi:hypothetical protein